MPSAASGLSRSLQRGLEPGRLQARRVDLHQQRAQVAHALAQARDRRRAAPPPRRRRRGASASSASGASPNATPARSCTTPSCRSAAIRRRSWLDASIARPEQPLALAVPALEPPGQRPRERHLEEQQDEQPAEQRRGERAQEPVALALTDAEALVDLEQHRGAVRRADHRVGLEQLALLALEAVLRLGEVGELGLRPAVAEQRQLLVAEPEVPPDQRAARPSRGSSRPATTSSRARSSRRDLAEHEVVEPGERGRLAAQHAVVSPADSTSAPSSCTRSRVSRSASLIVTGRSAKKPPTTTTGDRRRGCRAGSG